jgi:hypothetical protein
MALVSVVIPLFNSRRFLEQAMRSVLCQTFEDHEVLVCDDASTDGSFDVAQEIGRADARVKVLSNPRNMGVAAARNRALDSAQGKWIAFLDSDDWWHPRKLELQLDTLRESNAAVCYCPYLRVSEDCSVLGTVLPPSTLDYDTLLASNHIAMSSAMVSSAGLHQRFSRVGHEDYAFWLSVLRAGARAIRTPSELPLMSYRVHAGSLSTRKVRAALWQWRIYRQHEKLGLIPSVALMGAYGLAAIRKRIDRVG